jgi:hypothetical protein
MRKRIIKEEEEEEESPRPSSEHLKQQLRSEGKQYYLVYKAVKIISQ